MESYVSKIRVFVVVVLFPASESTTMQRRKRHQFVSMKAYFLFTIGKQTLREEKEMSITVMCLFVHQRNNVAFF